MTSRIACWRRVSPVTGSGSSVTFGRPGPRRSAAASAVARVGPAVICGPAAVLRPRGPPIVCQTRLFARCPASEFAGRPISDNVARSGASTQTFVRTTRRRPWFLSDPAGRHSNRRSIERSFEHSSLMEECHVGRYRVRPDRRDPGTGTSVRSRRPAGAPRHGHRPSAAARPGRRRTAAADPPRRRRADLAGAGRRRRPGVVGHRLGAGARGATEPRRPRSPSGPATPCGRSPPGWRRSATRGPRSLRSSSAISWPTSSWCRARSCASRSRPIRVTNFSPRRVLLLRNIRSPL